MGNRQMWKIGTFGALVCLLSGIGAVTQAQSREVAWYRIVNEGRSAGTMTTWRRVDAGAAATFPFLENFEVNIRPQGGNVEAKIRDGQSLVSATISCSGEHPRRAVLRATRSGADQAVIHVALRCSVSAPTVE